MKPSRTGGQRIRGTEKSNTIWTPTGDTRTRKPCGGLIDSLDRMKILEQVAILEEPFPPEVRAEVSDLPVCLAADESLHDISEVNERADLGYQAMAVKPAGKTLSKSLQMVQAAQGRGIPCFVADSACLPAAARVEQKRGGPFKFVSGVGDGDPRISRGADL